MHDFEMSLDLKLDLWRKEALIKAVCEKCFGSGEDKFNQGRACTTCNGAGRAPREPHVLELIEHVKAQQQMIDQLHAQLEQASEDRSRTAFYAGAKAMRNAIRQAVANSYDAGVVGVVNSIEVPDWEGACGL